MIQDITKEYAGVLKIQNNLPCISIIMPFEPKMSVKADLNHKLKIATDKIRIEMMADYLPEKAIPVLKKLQLLIKDLNYNTHKKTIAIFVSPMIEKVYYLDIPVEEKIIIDDSFEIRDLIYCKKQIHKYLLAELSSKSTKIYLGNRTHFANIISNVPGNIEAYKMDYPEKVANFCDNNNRKEILLDKFLKRTDTGLSLLLQAYQLSLFVMGTPKTIGHFKSITHNSKHVIEYIHGNFEEKTPSELHEIMEPFVSDWKKVIQADLLNQIDEAISVNKISIGINEVWKTASQKRGKLLIVEKNFMYPALHGSSPDIIYQYKNSINNTFYIKDAVDDLIEKVLANGGDVEFTDGQLLKNYDSIVLIEHYEHM
jgi:Bacterial archaeo-eukaryotic release factor family 3